MKKFRVYTKITFKCVDVTHVIEADNEKEAMEIIKQKILANKIPSFLVKEKIESQDQSAREIKYAEELNE